MPDARDLAVRRAAMRDVPELLRLINGYASQGIMLPRTEFEMAENIRDFAVVFDGERLAGCCALHFYTPLTGEIRSLAVAQQFTGRGIAQELIAALEVEARETGLGSVFAFTYIPEFFRKAGFVEIERGELPLKAWKDCLRCPKFQCCDEIAVIKPLRDGQMRVGNTPARGEGLLGYSGGSTSIIPAEILPVPRKPQ